MLLLFNLEALIFQKYKTLIFFEVTHSKKLEVAINKVNDSIKCNLLRKNTEYYLILD